MASSSLGLPHINNVMAYAFDSHSFGQLLDDAERLVTCGRDHEQRLASLVSLLEGTVVAGATATAGSPVSAAASGLEGETAAIDVGAATGLLATISQLRVVAGDYRQLAETILARLVGNRAVDSSPRLRARVLVVDDSDMSRETTATILEEAGFDAMTANNGLEAVIVAYYARPSIVLMDVTMPVLDGLEAARLIKASPVTRDIKVIAYTATPDVFEIPWTQWFVDVIPKPASADAIVSSVQRYAEIRT
jgi:twitching motility two-component system response regulator PilH